MPSFREVIARSVLSYRAGLGHGSLERGGEDMVPAQPARSRAARQAPRGERELPAQLLRGSGILSLKGVGQVYTSHATGQVALV